MFRSYVLPDGTLDEQRVLRREQVYQGMNGRFVERFFITPDQSFIFKPLTNESQNGKELWIHTHILKKLPSFYPKVLDSDQHWLIFEDLGEIDHHFSSKSVLSVTKQMANWHKTTSNQFDHFHQIGSPKPFIEEVVELLEARKEEVKCLASKIGIPQSTIDFLFNQLDKTSFGNKNVFSHGDLHLGNYGYAKGKLYIIDWEHAHFNSPYWDLYHLLDISHPTFPKSINKSLRTTALELYMDEAEYDSFTFTRISFKQGYYLFSSAFSLWMLLLIKADLDRKVEQWSSAQLRQQLEETVQSFKQCMEELQGSI
ncbi:phosphotransferase [Fredinandcohnia sp. 179-A 10B2 NHS]|uniref:phosphotransferase n=1 Tax=Fredinandcohnia sp. 179-A 10B2 NHS TaxID=3235176 RepID=UPI0039A378E9